MHDFSRQFPFDPDNEDYLVHITTGTHVAQICLFLLTESRRLARTGSSRPGLRGRMEHKVAGEYSIIDLDLSKYDRIATRFNEERGDDISFLKSGIDTRNSSFNQLIEQIESVARLAPRSDSTYRPHRRGQIPAGPPHFELKKARHRLEGNFVEVNCATLRGDAAMSALFGHKRGAFTGALRTATGCSAPPTAACCFLMKWENWGVTSRQCSCGRSRKKPSSRWGPTMKRPATSSCCAARTTISGTMYGGAVPRGPACPYQSLDLRTSRAP